jgi:hypothetical protein
MSGSFNFLFHLLGFGIIATTLLGGWLIERRLRREPEAPAKLALLRLNRYVGLLSPLASVLMLVTGTVNIINLYPANPNLWYGQAWLMAKVILFAFLLVNGAIFGPVISRRRSKLIRAAIENTAPAGADKTIHIYNKNITTFFLVQSLLLLVILYLSVFGGGKHPGVF